jgi:hypothetical protein
MWLPRACTIELVPITKADFISQKQERLVRNFNCSSISNMVILLNVEQFVEEYQVTLTGSRLGYMMHLAEQTAPHINY